MDRSFLHNPQYRTAIILACIAATTGFVLILNGYGLRYGITNVLPHLFYIPIILTAYYFPRRGVLFSIVISAAYFGMAFFFDPILSDVLWSAGGRVVIFILIAFVVSFLTTRLRESEIRFRGVAERSSDIILLTDREGRTTYVSPSSERILGYAPSEIAGKLPHAFIHPDDHGVLKESLQKFTQGSVSEEITLRFRKKDGDYIFMEFFGSPIMKRGAMAGFQVIGRDVTERKRAEEEQKTHDELLNTVLESMIAGVVIIDPETHSIVDVNAVAAAMIGAKKEVIIGSVCHNYICPAHEGACPITDLRQVVDRSEKVLLRADGERCPVLKSVVPIRLRNRTYLLESFIDISELVRARNALGESEEKYRMLADYTYDWEYWIGPDEAILYTTPSCERITGYTPAEFYATRRLINTLIHPEDQYALDHHMSHFFVPQKPGSVDFRIIHRDGSVRWIGHVCQPIYNSEGKFIGRRASNRDITERKRAEEENQETSRRLAEIISFLPDPTMVIDKTGVIVAWNHSMEVLSGIPAPDILGRESSVYRSWIAGQTGPILMDYILKQDIEGIKTAYPNVLFEGNTAKTEKDITHVNGTRYSLWISATPLIDQNGEITGAIESLRDVTHQKKIARALRESRQILEVVINTIPVRVFWKDKNLSYLGCNAAFARDAGFEAPEDMIGRDDFAMGWSRQAELYRADDRLVIETGVSRLLIEEPQTTPSGELIYLLTSKVPLRDANNEIIGVLGTYLDITERKLASEALRQANKKLNLLSGITRHDIRNQLLALEGYLAISRDTLDDPVRTAEFITKEEKIAAAIAHQILFTKDYEDLGVKAPVWQKVHTVITTVLPRLPLRNIRVDPGDPNLEVYADPLLEKVFYNLIDNALRYGGEQMTAILVANREENGVFILTVEDDGNGISADDKRQLFTKGFGRHTGLGLYLSREILAITGITITENGMPGRGARFEMTVPKGVYRFSDP
jgi:PAS domain S-box-containing protein